MGTWFTTREVVKSALDYKETARNNAQVDRAIEAASRSIEGLLHRRPIAPTIATLFFDWPNTQDNTSYRLWLDDAQLISTSLVSSGGSVISPSDYYLYPANGGPPYDRIELNVDSSASFGVSNYWQRNIAVTGLFGYSNDSASAGTIASSPNSSTTSINVSDSSLIGVGSIVMIDSERVQVTEKNWLTTSQTLQTPLTAAQNNVTVAVTNGAAYAVGETILLDSEKMLIVDIAGNNLTVKRAWDGSVLATHTGSTIYAPRTLTVQRGVLGTTPASHTSSTAITKWVPPGLIAELCVAEALNSLLQEISGYAARIRSGESNSEVTGRGVSDLRAATIRAHGRQARMRSV